MIGGDHFVGADEMVQPTCLAAHTCTITVRPYVVQPRVQSDCAGKIVLA